MNHCQILERQLFFYALVIKKTSGNRTRTPVSAELSALNYFVLFVYILTSDQRLKTKTPHRIGRLLLQEVMRPKAVLSVLLVYFLYQFLTDRLKGHMPCIEPLKG